MTLLEGEILEGVEMLDEGWWSARGKTGEGEEKEGLFPCTLSFFFSSSSSSVSFLSFHT